MTDDDNLDPSEITIQVKQGEVTLIGTVTTATRSAAPRIWPRASAACAR